MRAARAAYALLRDDEMPWLPQLPHNAVERPARGGRPARRARPRRVVVDGLDPLHPDWPFQRWHRAEERPEVEVLEQVAPERVAPPLAIGGPIVTPPQAGVGPYGEGDDKDARLRVIRGNGDQRCRD